MLIKEYRIPMPLSIEEYRIAQLYTILKKSRIDGGVQIIQNEPYANGPGGSGQYTYKIYHKGSQLPGWFPSALSINTLNMKLIEEAWNAYPYTKTIYTCPNVERFSVEIETVYLQGAGEQENVFRLNPIELQQRQIDVVDFVKDAISPGDYCEEEDPKLYQSQLTGRGPLSANWISERRAKSLPIICEYKLCRVEFSYWLIQSKSEQYIHDNFLRKTMLRAHRQAWTWQDEWLRLNIIDIRRLEEQLRQQFNQR